MYDASSQIAGAFQLIFTSPAIYSIGYCQSDTPTIQLPPEAEKVWTIILSRDDAGLKRVSVKCNAKEVVNLLLSDDTCDYRSWREKWERKAEKIQFFSFSDFFRQGRYLKLLIYICAETFAEKIRFCGQITFLRFSQIRPLLYRIKFFQSNIFQYCHEFDFHFQD